MSESFNDFTRRTPEPATTDDLIEELRAANRKLDTITRKLEAANQPPKPRKAWWSWG